MKNRELRCVHHEAEREFKRYPGVIGVGLGLKERGGQVTDEIAIRVYVREKVPATRLPDGQCIPPFFRGIPTDLQNLGRVVLLSSACEDRAKYSPIVGGITISPARAVGWVGTLGFFATINGAPEPDNIALITNNHVLEKN